MGSRNAQEEIMIERSFFLSDSGYFLISTAAHATFLTNGKSSMEKLQKKGWYRVDSQLASPYRELFRQNKFMLFYDKNQVVGPHNEMAWLRVWGKPNTERDKKENMQLIDCAKKVPKALLDLALQTIQKWHEEGPTYFGLPEDWDSNPLSPEMEEEILGAKNKPSNNRRRRKTKAKAKAKRKAKPKQEATKVITEDIFTIPENEPFEINNLAIVNI
jgi:hypothetical protein